MLSELSRNKLIWDQDQNGLNESALTTDQQIQLIQALNTLDYRKEAIALAITIGDYCYEWNNLPGAENFYQIAFDWE